MTVTPAILRRARLGHVRRTILVASEHGFAVCNGALDDSARHSRWRAARELERLGLVRLERVHAFNQFGIRNWRLLVAHVTDLGKRVLDTFRREFETGGRVRWARFDMQAA